MNAPSLSPAILTEVADALRIPQERREMFARRLVAIVAHSHGEKQSARVRATAVSDKLKPVLKAAHSLREALEGLREDDLGAAGAASSMLDAFLTANLKAKSEVMEDLQQLILCVEATARMAKDRYPGCGDSDANARDPYFTHFIIALSTLATVSGGKPTKGKKSDHYEDAGEWMGSVLEATEILKEHLPKRQNFFPKGKLGFVIDDILKAGS